LAQPLESTPTPSSRVTTLGFFALKVAVTVGLLAWLSRSGVLQLGSLRLLARTPLTLALTIGNWVFVSVVLSSSRWRILLLMLDVKLSFGRAAALQLMALFFNGVVPGNVGGDVMKSLYVAGTTPKATRKALLLLVLVERIIGLSGLMGAGALLTWSGLPTWKNDPRLIIPLATLGGFLLLLVAGPVALLIALRSARVRDGMLRLGGRHALLARAVDALVLVRTHQTRLIQAFGVSVLLHTSCMAYFTYLSGIYGQPAPSIEQIALIFPLGILSVVLPVWLAGLGVGHVAFEQLFKLIGASNGANVFNLYVIGQLAPSALGAIPCLFWKKQGPAS